MNPWTREKERWSPVKQRDATPNTELGLGSGARFPFPFPFPFHGSSCWVAMCNGYIVMGYWEMRNGAVVTRERRIGNGLTRT